MKNRLMLVLVCGVFFACAMMKTPTMTIHTLGIAEVEVCKEYTFRDDGLIQECERVETDAFSGWEAIIQGIGNTVVKILTLGLL